MDRKRQENAPIAEALEQFRASRVVPFDVPGHKRGKGNPALTAFLGEQCLSVDVNAMKPLDNLTHPVGVIAEAERIAADAFGSHHAFFMVGGTSSSVQAMVLFAVREGEKIILPRNVHRSVIYALVLSGAVPVYVDPQVSDTLGIPLGMSVSEVESTMQAHPDAKAILLNNPTYYGVCSDLARMTEMAHTRGMLVLADEAHGTHFSFGASLPISAMAAGADLSAVSMHKSGGSLTQSSFLLSGPAVDFEDLRSIINLTQTTSGSYLLLSSLDLSRRNMALHGTGIIDRVLQLTEYAREEINEIGGYDAFSAELINGDTVYAMDPTKLAVNTRGIGRSGVEVYDLLRDEYQIQIEFGELSNVLAYVSVGDTPKDMERLIGALSEIRRLHAGPPKERAVMAEYLPPEVVEPPRVAFYAAKESLRLTAAVGRTAGEFVMAYPPGIPMISPGERITSELVSYIGYAKQKGSFLTGMKDPNLQEILVLK